MATAVRNPVFLLWISFGKLTEGTPVTNAAREAGSVTSRSYGIVGKKRGAGGAAISWKDSMEIEGAASQFAVIQAGSLVH